MILKSRNCVQDDDFDTHCDCYYDQDDDQSHTINDFCAHYKWNCGRDDNKDHIIKNLNYKAGDVYNKSSDDMPKNVWEINTVAYTDNNVQPDSLYNVSAMQQDDFVCDNNQYYLNNNNCDPVNNRKANNIQAIVITIIQIRMNGMFYIPAKKKHILYLLIPKKRRSFYTSKKKISCSYITKKIDNFHIYMATKFDHNNCYTILSCAVNYDNMMTTINKMNDLNYDHDLYNLLYNANAVQQDNFVCDHVSVC